MVGLHASTDIQGRPFPDFELMERIAPVLFRTVIYTARTELFLVISIFLLMMSLDHRPRGYRATLAEQARRLLLPFTFWLLFYAFFRLIKAHYFGYTPAILAELSSPSHWLSYFLLGSVEYHMHFLPTLFGLVIAYPVFRLAQQRPWLGAIILVCLFVKREIDVYLWSSFSGQEFLPYLIRLTKLITYLGYGMVAASFFGLLKHNLSSSTKNKAALITVIVMLFLFAVKLVHAQMVITDAHWHFNFTPAYWADFLFPVLLFAFCFFRDEKHWPEIISRWAPYSFGIYLTHPIFLSLAEVALWNLTFAPWVFVGLKVVCALLGAIALTYALSRIKILAWTVGLGPFPISFSTTTKPSTKGVSNGI